MSSGRALKALDSSKETNKSIEKASNVSRFWGVAPPKPAFWHVFRRKHAQNAWFWKGRLCQNHAFRVTCTLFRAKTAVKSTHTRQNAGFGNVLLRPNRI